MKELELTKELAKRILEGKPDPVVRFRLLRDVLKVPSDAELISRTR